MRQKLVAFLCRDLEEPLIFKFEKRLSYKTWTLKGSNQSRQRCSGSISNDLWNFQVGTIWFPFGILVHASDKVSSRRSWTNVEERQKEIKWSRLSVMLEEFVPLECIKLSMTQIHFHIWSHKKAIIVTFLSLFFEEKKNNLFALYNFSYLFIS